MTSGGWARIRLGCAASSAVVFALAVIVIGSRTSGYDQWSDPVSRLASPGEPWALAARAAFAAYGLLVVAGVSTLQQYAGHHRHMVVYCLTLYGVACVVAGVAPKDQPGTAHTVVSQLHVAAAVLAGALLIGAMTLVSRCGPTRATRRAAAAMALLTGLAAIIFRYTWGTQVYGISERILLALGMCWISALAARALIAITPDASRGRRGSGRFLRMNGVETDVSAGHPDERRDLGPYRPGRPPVPEPHHAAAVGAEHEHSRILLRDRFQQRRDRVQALHAEPRDVDPERTRTPYGFG
jgi:hypothetical protein